MRKKKEAMAQRSIMTKGTSFPLQISDLSTSAQAEVLFPPDYVLKDVQKMIKEFEDRFTRELNQLKLQMEEKLEKSLRDIRDQIDTSNGMFRRVLVGVHDNTKALSIDLQECQEEQKTLQQNITRMEEQMKEYEWGLLQTQYKELEYVLRLRGLKEGKEEKLKNICAEAFSALLQVDPADMQEYIGKIYRVNSWVARQKNLPRDVLVYFEKKQVRYDIAQAAYIQGFKIQGQPVRVFKEIPIKILKMRKDFTFLTDELKKRGLPFRWEIPCGVMVNYMGHRYRLLSVQKAREFYYNVLHGGELGEEEETQMEEDGEAILADPVEEGLQARDVEKQEVQDVRITRAMAKKMKK